MSVFAYFWRFSGNVASYFRSRFCFLPHFVQKVSVSSSRLLAEISPSASSDPPAAPADVDFSGVLRLPHQLGFPGFPVSVFPVGVAVFGVVVAHGGFSLLHHSVLGGVGELETVIDFVTFGVWCVPTGPSSPAAGVSSSC